MTSCAFGYVGYGNRAGQPCMSDMSCRLIAPVSFPTSTDAAGVTVRPVSGLVDPVDRLGTHRLEMRLGTG